MSDGTHIPGMESIEAHAEFVRALARSLLLDENRADDVAQQALLTAMERASGGIRRPRAWLATVTRNLVRRGFRSDRRRTRREEGAARPESEPAAADLAARLETRERLVRAVRELREPFRETVLLRYFEGHTPDEIAKQKGIPASTVRGRLSRALAMLRERLDRDHENDRRAWSLLLLPLALPRNGSAAGAAAGASTAAAIGGLAVSGKKIAVIAVVLIALSIGGALLVSEATAPSQPVLEAPLANTPQAESVTAEPAEPTGTGDRAAATAEIPETARNDWPVRVETNVPGAEVTVVATYYGGEPDPEPLVKTADANGFAGFTLPKREDPLFGAIARATAQGYGPAVGPGRYSG